VLLGTGAVGDIRGLVLGVRARQLASPGGALPQHRWFGFITDLNCDLDHISLAQ
jgi:hypothetical protein